MANIKVKSVDEVITHIKNKISAFKQMAILDDVGQYMVKEVTDRFKYNRIKPRTSTATLLARRAKGYKRISHAKRASTRAKLISSSNTLVDTGRLMRSIKYRKKGKKLQVQIGTNIEYAAIHQFGGRTGRNRSTKIPKRPYLYFTSVNRIRIKQIVRSYIEEA